jgi:2-C-methyl-D-erythritol 2,4-cyclodiphosphate synthase
LGHSDGDVILHAVADAIAGAAGLPDIGQLFPDTLRATEGIDSRIIVEKMLHGASEKKLRVVNLDAVVQAESPRIADYKQQMRESIAQMLSVNVDAVNLKGRTAEGMGDIGKNEAIACTAIVGMGSNTNNNV